MQNVKNANSEYRGTTDGGHPCAGLFARGTDGRSMPKSRTQRHARLERDERAPRSSRKYPHRVRILDLEDVEDGADGFDDDGAMPHEDCSNFFKWTIFVLAVLTGTAIFFPQAFVTAFTARNESPPVDSMKSLVTAALQDAADSVFLPPRSPPPSPPPPPPWLLPSPPLFRDSYVDRALPVKATSHAPDPLLPPSVPLRSPRPPPAPQPCSPPPVAPPLPSSPAFGWSMHAGFNCWWSGHGAEEVDSPPGSTYPGVISPQACQQACDPRLDQTQCIRAPLGMHRACMHCTDWYVHCAVAHRCAKSSICEGVLMPASAADSTSARYIDCYRKTSIELAKCQIDPNFDLYVKLLPPLPPAPPPLPAPPTVPPSPPSPPDGASVQAINELFRTGTLRVRVRVRAWARTRVKLRVRVGVRVSASAQAVNETFHTGTHMLGSYQSEGEQ